MVGFAGNFLAQPTSGSGGSAMTPGLLQGYISQQGAAMDPQTMQLLNLYMMRKGQMPSGNFLAQQQEEEQGGGMWNLLGPVGNVIGQTMDGKKGINWGSVGQSAYNNALATLGIASGNPMLAMQGVGGVARQSF